MVLVFNFFVFLKFIFFSFLVAMTDLVHDVKAIFLNYSHYLEIFSGFLKRFPDIVSS